MHDFKQSTCAKPVRPLLTTVVVGLQGDDEGCCQDGDKTVKVRVAASAGSRIRIGRIAVRNEFMKWW